MIRLAVMTALVVSLGALTGCHVNPEAYDEKSKAADVGAYSADIARSRAMQIHDTIALIENERADMRLRRADLLKDAKEYRSKASQAAYDRGMGEGERQAYAAQFRCLAELREREAANYKILMESYASRIRILSNQAERQETNANRVERILMATSE